MTCALVPWERVIRMVGSEKVTLLFFLLEVAIMDSVFSTVPDGDEQGDEGS